MKKLVSLVLALAMILSMTAFAQVAETEASWRAKAFECVQNLDIMRGDETGDMKLEDYLTRQEMFSLMYRLTAAVGLMDTATQSTWNMYASVAGSYVGDMSSVSFWAVPYAAYNWVNRIFTGDDKGNLKPQGNLSYYDCATVLLRALGYENTLLLANGQWRLNVLHYGMEAGLWNYLSVTDLNAPITRANIAVMVYNALQARKVTCTTSNGVTTYTFNANTLIKTNFGFDNVNGIVSGGLVTAYCDADKTLLLNEETWVDASDIGVTNADLPGLYGQVITWVAKPAEKGGKVLRAAEIYDLNWVEFSYRGTDSIKIEAKGYKADKKTEIVYTDPLCAYLRVTTGGTTYVVPNVPVYESWNEYLEATTYNWLEGETTVYEMLDDLILDYTYYSTETNTIRFVDAGEGGGIVFFDNQYAAVKVYDKNTDTYDSTNKTITLGGWGTYKVQSNLLAGLTDGDVIVINTEELYYDDIDVILSVTKIDPTNVNGGLLTASYTNGNWTGVKLDGAAIGVSNGLTANSLADAGTYGTSLYALAEAKTTGNKLGYVYVLDGYIVHASTTNYTTTTPVTPVDDYFVYVTKAPTFAFDGALLKVTFEGNVNGVNGSYTVILANAAMLENDDPANPDDFETFTIAEANTAFAAGKLVKVDPASDTIDVTGQKVDRIYDTLVSSGYVYRWINLAYNNIDKEVAVANITYVGEDAVKTLANGTVTLGTTDVVYYRDALVADNADTSKVEGNSITAAGTGLIAMNNIAKMAEITKSVYYTYNNGTKVVYVFMANSAFKSDKRALWDNGSPTTPTGTSYMLLASAPTLTLLGNGDVTATLTGYIDGTLTTYILKVKAGDMTTLPGILQANEVVELVYTPSTDYTACASVAGENYSAGYIIRYVNETYMELNKTIVTDNAGDITIGAANQVIVGSYAEERYNTLASEITRYNAVKDPDFTLAQIAQTAYVKYTANGKTYVVFSANSKLDAAKRTTFVEWVAANPDLGD